MCKSLHGMAKKTLIRQHNQTVLNDLEDGDLVEFPRGYYSHWGVYVGEENIIHLAGEEEGNDGINAGIDSGHLFTVCGRKFNKARAKVDNFWDVTATSKAKKNNNKDKKCKPFSPEKIKERAFSKLGAIPYNVLFSNCEHFAAWCRNGENWSQQAESFLLTMVIGVGAAVVAGGLAAVVAGGLAYAGLSGGRKKEKEQKA